MSEEKKDGGDIASGHGESEVKGPVSDDKAQQMLYSGGEDPEPVPSPEEKKMISEGGPVGEPEQLTEQDVPRKPGRGGGGGGGGAW